MLSAIRIKNFQSHRDTQLSFSTGLNVIVGSSDTGKSSILRALGWLTWNRPAGKAFVRYGTTDAFVGVVVEDAVAIERLRTSTKNEYKINGEVLKAMGSNVPVDVSAACNFSPINFQNQFDGYYLLFDSPGKFASELNSIIHLEDAEKATDLLAQQIRSLSGDIRKTKESVAITRQRLLDPQKVDVLEEKIDEYESVEKKIVKIGINRKELISLIDRIILINKTLDRIGGNRVDEVSKRLSSFLTESNREEGIDYDCGHLSSLVKSMKSISTRLADKKETVKLEGKLRQFDIEYDNQDKKKRRIGYLIQKTKALALVLDKQNKAKASVKEAEEAYVRTYEEMDKLVAALDTCVLCDGRIRDKTVYLKNLVKIQGER